ncbi:MAG TPA: trimethylamine methyltransferase family protein, partial [Geminicoccus sp.]|uniref:trimethylamine methyltransferase family protein n=1 Tax=Geminicoccus sp. TaxID=2024832 RepID=UPI002E342836
MREAGRDRRRARRATDGGIAQRPWREVVNHLPPTEPLSADQVEKIHDSSLRILEEIGIEFLHPEALSILGRAGAQVTPGSMLVKFDRGLVLELIGKAPSRFTLHARNPAHDLQIGGNVVNFATVASTPNAHDRAGGRRSGNFRDFTNFVKLGQSLNCIHLYGGYPVEPIDLPPQTRHLDCLQAFVTLSDKAFHAYSLGHTRITDGIEIARIARGISREQLQREPSLFTIINSNSPLRLDGPMLEGIMAMAGASQVVVLTPFTLAGAMAP